MENNGNHGNNTIPADKAMLHLTMAARRMFIACIVMCIAFIAAIVIFTQANTARERNILDMMVKLHPGMMEVQQYGEVPK